MTEEQEAEIRGQRQIGFVLDIAQVDLLLAEIDRLRAQLQNAVRIASFVKCDMDCETSTRGHWEDCLVSQANAAREALEQK